MAILELRQVRAISPTLAEMMRSCFLRAGLSRANGSGHFVLGSPKAWLGTAYHEVLEKIVATDPYEESLERAAERLWDEAIATQTQRADAHVLNRRFGSATTWPGYYVARASALLRAAEMAAGTAQTFGTASKQPSDARPVATVREQEFAALDGKLIGRPDVIRPEVIIDYKSGPVFEHDAATQAEVVKAAYVRQLRIYGYLVRQRLGSWPKRGVLLPLGGAGVEVALEPAECEREAAQAVALLDAYNGMVRSGAAPNAFASPSVQSCRWCAYKIVCPVFWHTATPEWSGQVDGAAVEGTLAGEPNAVHGGAARAIAVDVKAGTEPRRPVQISPLNPSTHAIVAALATGERVRLVGLRVRPDGVLLPTQRTVVGRTTDLPGVAVISAGPLGPRESALGSTEAGA